jgi:hypothetical protein
MRRSTWYYMFVTLCVTVCTVCAVVLWLIAHTVSLLLYTVTICYILFTTGESCIFIFVTRAYDVGDTVHFKDDMGADTVFTVQVYIYP